MLGSSGLWDTAAPGAAAGPVQSVTTRHPVGPRAGGGQAGGTLGGQSLALPLPAQARRPRAAGDSTASVKNLEGTKQPAASRSETTSAARVLPSPGFAPTFSVCLNVTQSQRPARRRLEVRGQGRCLELRGCPCSPGLVPPDRDVLEDKGVAMTPSKA